MFDGYWEVCGKRRKSSLIVDFCALWCLGWTGESAAQAAFQTRLILVRKVDFSFVTLDALA